MTTHQDRRSVGVGVDGTEHSEAARRYALAEGRRRGALVRLVHVEPGFRPVMPHVLVVSADVEAIGRSILREAVEASTADAPDVAVKGWLRRGGRVLELVAAAESFQVMVVGRESMHGVDRLLLGTVTNGVAAHAPCPVHVVPDGWTGHDGPVVVGVRTSTQVGPLAEEAAVRSADRGRHVVVVHAWHLPDPYADRIETRVHADRWRRSAAARIDDALEQVRSDHPDVRFETRVSHADPVTALLDVADASLVVVERAHHASWLPGSLGRTARHLLARSPAPVEVVPVAAAPDRDGDLVLESSGSLQR